MNNNKMTELQILAKQFEYDMYAELLRESIDRSDLDFDDEDVSLNEYELTWEEYCAVYDN